MENKEKMMQLQMLEQEAGQLDQQVQMIEQHLVDMVNLKDGLDELEKPESKEILANLGKGIYIPAEIKDKKLFVEIGQKNVVKKTIPEAKKIIEEQVKKLNVAKQQVMERVESLQIEMTSLMSG
tara:strand:+ start:155 stop:526 length:372 start_codon:yes stop_codon:yes gene_type:complete